MSHMTYVTHFSTISSMYQPSTTFNYQQLSTINNYQQLPTTINMYNHQLQEVIPTPTRCASTLLVGAVAFCRAVAGCVGCASIGVTSWLKLALVAVM